MKRIIIHWSAGGYTASDIDRQHYHYIIDGAGKVHHGNFPVVANEAPQKGKYAAHTLNCNTGSIGVAVAAMAGAVERPFNAGSAPILPIQMQALAALCAKLGRDYSIAVSRETMLTHAEVQPTLGIKQRGKWDISWLPGMTAVGDPVLVGDKIRAMIRDAAPQVTSKPVVVRKAVPEPDIHPTPSRPTTKSKAPAVGAAILALLAAIWAYFTKG